MEIKYFFLKKKSKNTAKNGESRKKVLFCGLIFY